MCIRTFIALLLPRMNFIINHPRAILFAHTIFFLSIILSYLIFNHQRTMKFWKYNLSNFIPPDNSSFLLLITDSQQKSYCALLDCCQTQFATLYKLETSFNFYSRFTILFSTSCDLNLHIKFIKHCWSFSFHLHNFKRKFSSFNLDVKVESSSY